MLNQELIDLCRTVVGAIQETDGFDAGQLRRLLLRIVPQLLAELDILANVLESVLDDKWRSLEEEAKQLAAPLTTTAPEPKQKKKRKKGRR